MKRFAIVFPILVVSLLTVRGQELKSRTITTSVYKVEFNVLSKDKKVKHGEYKKYTLDNKQIWTGQMDNDKQVGEWNYYENGQVVQTYDYSKGLLTFQQKTTDLYYVQIDSQIKVINIDAPPDYRGSKIGLTEELNSFIIYPLEARRMGIEGIVMLGVWINEDGSLGEIELVKGLTNECDQELIRATKAIVNRWIPGSVDGKKCKSKFVFKALYKLQSSPASTSITVI